MSFQTEIAEQFHHTVDTILLDIGSHLLFIVVEFRNSHRLGMDAKPGRLGVIGKLVVTNMNPFRVVVVQ